MYSQKVLEQFQNSAHVGELPDASVYVQSDNAACGDILHLALKVSSGRITKVRFRARGCVAAIACGAQLADMLEGRTLAEASAFSREEIVAALGGLPPASTHASHLAMDALRSALRQVK